MNDRPDRVTARNLAADVLDRCAVALLSAANRLRPVDDRPRCPDCQIGPDLGPDVECPVCRERWEQQNYESAIYDAGRQDGYRDGLTSGDERSLL